MNLWTSGFVDGLVRRMPMRQLLRRVFTVSITAALVLLSAAVAWLVYTYLVLSSAGELAMHVEAIWYQAYPETRPAETRVGPPPGGSHPLPDGPAGPAPRPPGGPPPPGGPIPGGAGSPLAPPPPVFELQAPPDLERDAPTLVHDIASHPFFTARIVTVAGQVLAASRGADDLPQMDFSIPPVAPHRPWFAPHRLMEVRGRPLLVVALPIVRGGRVVAIVQASRIWWLQTRLLRVLALVSVIGLLVSVAVAYALSARLAGAIVAPLERLAGAAGRIARGDLSARVELAPGPNELSAVAASFDDMAARLQESFAAQKRFVADASHELKTPITAFGGMVDLLEAGVDTSPAQREIIVSTMSREVERMSTLVNDLLVLSRAEHGDGRHDAVDLAEVARRVVEEARQIHPDRPIDSALTPALYTRGDVEGVRRAITNVVDNALKYSPADTRVNVRASRAEDGGVEVVVQDDGPGIPVDALPHVFERFYRADHSRTRATGGSGLGLAIVKAIVEGAGGTVFIESGTGSGTTVTMRLPAA